MKSDNKRILTLLLAGLLVCASSMAVAEELYKYVNEQGVTVLDSHVPPQYVKFGYTILSADGRVMEVVPRAPTAEEIAALERQREREAADAALLRLYGSPEDVERARDTKLNSLVGFVTAARTTLERLFEQKVEVEAEIANIERADDVIPPEQLARIRAIQSRIDQTRSEIAAKTEEIEVLEAQYATDLKRVTELYKEQDTSS